MRPARRTVLALFVAGAATSVPTAQAVVPLQRITGSGPITSIALGNDLSCQMTARGDPQPSFEPIGSELGDCGVYIRATNTANGDIVLFGPSDRVFLPGPDQVYSPDLAVGTNGQLTSDLGGGTTAVSTRVLLGSTGLSATQSDIYRAGDSFYSSGIDLHNDDPGGATYDVSVYRVFLCYLQGSASGDFGFHVLTVGELPGCNTGPGVTPARAESLTALVVPTNWVVDHYGNTRALFGAGDFPNTCLCGESSDLLVGLSWRRTLGPGESNSDIAWQTTSSGAAEPPQPAQTANASTQSGTVRVQAPGGQFVDLAGLKSIPVGSLVDTTKGVVSLTAAATGKTKTQRGTFGGGVFKFTQARKRVRGKRRLVTNLTLKGGSFGACKTRAAPDAGSARRREVRYLAAKANGQFTVIGKYSSGLERGTTWRTSDTCGGTLTRVTKGTVAVRDFAKRRTVLVRAGHSYLARPR